MHQVFTAIVLPSPYPNANAKVSNGEASPDLPASVLISGFHKLNDRWAVSSSVRWTDWKDSFQEFTLVSPNAIILDVDPV